MSELNRCGCGGRAHIEGWECKYIIGDTGLLRVMCTRCRISTIKYTERNAAIKAWNRAMPNTLTMQSEKHDLKIRPEYFGAVLDGSKRFEIRKNDRNFQVGDTIALREWDDDYTGRGWSGRITYVTDYMQRPGHVVFGIESLFAPRALTPERVDELCVSYEDAELVSDWPSGFMHGQEHLAKQIKQELKGSDGQQDQSVLFIQKSVGRLLLDYPGHRDRARSIRTTTPPILHCHYDMDLVLRCRMAQPKWMTMTDTPKPFPPLPDPFRKMESLPDERRIPTAADLNEMGVSCGTCPHHVKTDVQGVISCSHPEGLGCLLLCSVKPTYFCSHHPKLRGE